MVTLDFSFGEKPFFHSGRANVTAAHGHLRRVGPLRRHLRRHHDHHLRRHPAGRSGPIKTQGTCQLA